MIKIAITGNIAAGKSVVEKFLLNLNYPVIDSDKIVHNLFLNSKKLISQIDYLFGKFDIYNNSGLDRKKLANLVFSDKIYLKQLENIIHPLVIQKINDFINKNSNEAFVFASVPLLFEVGWNYMFDKIIMVASDEKIRLKRLMQRNNLSEQDAYLRINSQMPQDEKIKRADFVIYNNTNYIDLRRQLNTILLQLI